MRTPESLSAVWSTGSTLPLFLERFQSLWSFVSWMWYYFTQKEAWRIISGYANTHYSDPSLTTVKQIRNITVTPDSCLPLWQINLVANKPLILNAESALVKLACWTGSASQCLLSKPCTHSHLQSVHWIVLPIFLWGDWLSVFCGEIQVGYQSLQLWRTSQED